jgi:hypothetical protein
MFKTEEVTFKDLPNGHTSPPPALRAASTVSSTDGSDSDDSSGVATVTRRRPPQKQQQGQQHEVTLTESFSFVSSGTSSDDHTIEQSSIATRTGFTAVVSAVLSGITNAALWIAFSLYFPFILAPYAASKTYDAAFYKYHPEMSHFDNTVWTYGTDYALAVVMAVIVNTTLRLSTRNVTDKLCRRSSSLLLLYAVSVIAGGCAHQFFTTLDSRNTLAFRFLWTVCVGTVCSGSISMGMSGSEAIRKFQQLQQQQQEREPNNDTSSLLLMKVPVLTDAFWLAYGGTVTIVCALGGISFQRPACDIFIAGITQSPSTFYCMIFFLLVRHERVQLWAKVVGFVGFILNAPLLPMYPLLVQYTDWSLASVNTLLHCWLCVAWSMQGISMRHVIRALNSSENTKKKVV